MADPIRASQGHQHSALPTKPRAMSRSHENDLPGTDGHAKREPESTQRHKKRGSGSHEKPGVQAVPVQMHLKYREEVADRDEAEERGAPADSQ